MTRPAERGTHRRSCRTCGWSGTYDTAARGDYAKRRHSCERHLRLAARKANGEAIRARHALIDRTPKPCLHQETTHVHGTYACWTQRVEDPIHFVATHYAAEVLAAIQEKSA